FDRAFAAWRASTEEACAPADTRDRVMRAIEPRVVDMLWALGRPLLLAASVVSVVLAVAAASSVRAAAREAADYAMSRAQ
ncbi:MAG TPA: hypothetical protein VHV30_00560, partial [Polyangiaceae bacterium]|nr:hypothetical protein [Polyangiaceae bacterium]